MPVFQYKAVSPDGKTITGTLSASNRQQVADILSKRQNYPVSIEEKKAVGINLRRGSKVSSRDISVFCRQFYAMLNSGVNILSSLDILRVQIENKKLKAVMNEIYEDVQKGYNLSGAMKRHPEDFPELLINMIEAGEASGTLDTVMMRMASHYEKEYKLNNKIKNAMVYPTVLMVVAFGVVFFLTMFVMPTFITMFTSSGVELPLPTRILLGFSTFSQDYWYLIFAGIGAGVYGIRQYLASDKGRWKFDQWRMNAPMIKNITEKIVASRFTRTLATLLSSGIPLLQALENVSSIVGNRVVEQGILKIRDDVRRGQSLADPIKASGFFPPMVDNMIRIGEEAGTIDDLMDKTADFYDEEVDVLLTRMTTLFEPIMIVFMGIIIGFIVISIALPMFDMVKTVN